MIVSFCFPSRPQIWQFLWLGATFMKCRPRFAHYLWLGGYQ